MAIDDNSYGSVLEVAALTKRYTSGGTYTASTRPTITEVEQFIDRISSIINLLMADKGFAIPIDQADSKRVCDELVVESVIDLCHAANSAGRFYTDRQLRGKAPLRVLRQELVNWVDDVATGFENLGATRITSQAEQGGFRDEDESGEDTFPIFQRKAYGNRFRNWDS